MTVEKSKFEVKKQDFCDELVSLDSQNMSNNKYHLFFGSKVFRTASTPPYISHTPTQT